jgi:hypothetical protein
VPCATDCDDGVECTLDACVGGVCLNAPIPARCDAGACAVWACLPGNAAADKRGCVALDSSIQGAGCTDDGLACTDDICTPLGCLHVPVDSRCVPADACTAAVCSPDAGDATGCMAGPPLADGAGCAEDGDACTLDVCRNGGCAHEPIVAVESCRPVQAVFSQALGLKSLTQDIAGDVALAGNGNLTPLTTRLARIEEDLAAAARALAGTPVLSTTYRALADGGPMSAAERARIAFTQVLRTPREVNGFLQALAQAQARAALRRSTTRALRRRGRYLLRGTRGLKRNLAALQSSSSPGS